MSMTVDEALKYAEETLNGAFEEWLSLENPHGDCESVQRQWDDSAMHEDIVAELQPVMVLTYEVKELRAELHSAREEMKDWQTRAEAAPVVPDATCKPSLQVPQEWREVLAGLVAIAEKKGKRQGSPNHCHARPGIWDDDNGVLAGLPCAECAMYDRARALLQSSTAGLQLDTTP